MLRKLVVGLASACLVLMPMSVQALGFGNIKLNSALNEPLDARIDLISPSEADLESLTVKLASESAFTRAGIDRPHFLSSLEFEVVADDGVIRVRSKESIREPFVNFLVEFSWDNGRMLREYTMLLDPPGQMMREPAPAMAETPVTEEPTDTIQRYEPQPYTPEPVTEAEPTMPDAPDTAQQPEPPAPQAQPEMTDEPGFAEEEEISGAQADDAVADTGTASDRYTDPFVDDGSLFPRIDISGYRSADGMELGELDYGVTKQGDNAWTIAEKLKSNAGSASIYQIMMALLQSNPEAFVDGNIHRLKTGQVLRIEDPSLLNAMSQQQAANDYMAQTEDWEQYRQAVAERTGRQAVVAEAGTREQPVRAEQGGELTLSSPDGDDLQAGAGASEEAMSNDLIALRDEMRQLRENASSTQERNTELNRQLQEMEEELARLQRSVSIKDDELAALQQQLAELNAKPALPETPPADEADGAEASESQPAEEAVPEAEIAAEETGAEREAEMAARPEEAQPAESPRAPVEDEAPAAEDAPQASPAPEPEPEPKGMVAEYLAMAKDIFNSAVGVVTGMISASGNSLLMYVAAPVLLVLVILMLIVVRRRRLAEGNYQESILSGGPSTMTNSTEAGADSGESSFLSDFAVSGAGAIQTEDSEVDPLTEADVFIAYGRYEAAEERLQEAIEQEPGRKELKLKMLELYNTTQNASAFENLAEEFYASLGGEAESDPMWEKVVGMGKQLAPNNPLFAAGAVAAASSSAFGNDDPGVGLSDSQVMDIGLDSGVFDSSDFADAGGQAESQNSDLDFNLDFGTDSDTASASEQLDAGGLDFSPDTGGESSQAADSEMDFNLDMNTQAPAGDESPGMDFTPGGGSDDTEGGLDFNLGGESDTADTKNDLEFNLDDLGGGSGAEADSDLSLDFDTGSEQPAAGGGDAGLDFNLGGEDDTASLDFAGGEQADDEATMSIDAGGLDFGGTDQGGMELDLDTSSDSGESDMPLGGGDEVGTKLDLARAYIDMGDPDGARSILDEVLDEGNDSQKQEAQQLIQQIA